MKPVWLVLSFLASADAWGARTAFQVRCEDSIGKTVTVLTASQQGYSVDNTQSIKALTRMKGAAAASGHVLGLTRTEARVSVALGGPMLLDPKSGYECVAPRIDVALTSEPIVVYVGSEFKPGTCAYREVLAHEMRHLKTYIGHLPKVEATVRAALNRRFQDKPLYAPAGQARALLAKEINQGWMPYIKAELGKIELMQAAIDTPQEYKRLSKICRGEVQSIIRSTTRQRK